MTEPPLRFWDFELDPAQFELRRAGHRVRLERKPLELLILLVEKRGELVSREEIIERVWGKDFFFDAERGINNAIRKIRSALNDDSEEPHYVETVVGKGFRFLAPREGRESRSTILLCGKYKRTDYCFAAATGPPRQTVVGRDRSFSGGLGNPLHL